eukprot:COSAG02_NODE_10957_length_1824_cov_16.928696_3_plen_73_part_00
MTAVDFEIIIFLPDPARARARAARARDGARGHPRAYIGGQLRIEPAREAVCAVYVRRTIVVSSGGDIAQPWT